MLGRKGASVSFAPGTKEFTPSGVPYSPERPASEPGSSSKRALAGFKQAKGPAGVKKEPEGLEEGEIRPSPPLAPSAGDPTLLDTLAMAAASEGKANVRGNSPLSQSVHSAVGALVDYSASSSDTPASTNQPGVTVKNTTAAEVPPAGGPSSPFLPANCQVGTPDGGRSGTSPAMQYSSPPGFEGKVQLQVQAQGYNKGVPEYSPLYPNLDYPAPPSSQELAATLKGFQGILRASLIVERRTQDNLKLIKEFEREHARRVETAFPAKAIKKHKPASGHIRASWIRFGAEQALKEAGVPYKTETGLDGHDVVRPVLE